MASNNNNAAVVSVKKKRAIKAGKSSAPHKVKR